jgi:hypothetical protein
MANGAATAGQEVFAAATNDELDALVAPIALYPDALVALVLGAATYPDQVVEADTYVRANMALPWEQLIQGAEERSWDPSVTGLVQFAVVLNKMAKNIVWTSTLGEAVANQQTDVVVAIQRMRAKAYGAGNLKSGERMKVVQERTEIVVIQPANPRMVYVPSYNPALVYGTTVTSPGYGTGEIAASAAISFGLGVAVGGPVRAVACGWRYGYWHVNWDEWTIHCGNGIYFGNPYWWGGAYPGFVVLYKDRMPAEKATPTMLSGPAGRLTTRSGPGVANTKLAEEELRGYVAGANTRPAAKANVFSGTMGGRAESERGNRSLNESKPPNVER